jgi:hypothetical protein
MSHLDEKKANHAELNPKIVAAARWCIDILAAGLFKMSQTDKQNKKCWSMAARTSGNAGAWRAIKDS